MRKLKSNFWKKSPRKISLGNLITVVATLVMAITSVCMLIVSYQSIKVSTRITEQDFTRLQAELRPYLIPELMPNNQSPELPIDNQFFFRDDQSRLFFKSKEGKFLLLRFRIKNVGKMPARNIKAQYYSPDAQQGEHFDLGTEDVCLSPGAESVWSFQPAIDVSSIINSGEAKSFPVRLMLTYEGNKEIAPGTYSSVLKLTIKKENDRYRVIDKDFRFEE